VTDEHGVPLRCQRSLWCHRSPRSLRLGKGLLTKLGPDTGTHPLKVSLLVRDDK
jgi:hypothetical protein